MNASSSDTPEPDTPSGGGFVGAARVVAGLTLLSRVFGLARDAVCSRVFGAGPVWSAFALAFLIPNLTRRLFGEGALAAAFIPEYTRLLRADPPAAARYASALITLTGAALAALTLLAEAALLALLFWTPLGDRGALALQLTMVLLPFAPMICVTALIGGVLQSHGRFAPTAAAPVILNVCIIAGVLAWKGLGGGDLRAAAFSAAVAVIIAGVLQIAWSLAAARRHTSWTRAWRGTITPLVRTARATGRVVLGLGALQLNTLLDGLIASWPVLVGPTIAIPLAGTLDYPLDEASNATLFFASRLYQFPLGVFGIALATAVFPLLAKQADEPGAFAGTLRTGLRLAFFIGLPASAGLMLVSTDLTAVILSGGLFDSESVRRVSVVLMCYAPAVWAYAVNHTLTRAFYARGDTTTPMRITLVFVALNLALNLGLIWPFGEAGLALSTAVCSIGQSAVLCARWRKHAPHGLLADPALRTSVAATIGLTAVMAAAVWGVMLALGTPETWPQHAVRLAAAVASGGGVYALLALAGRRPELRWLTAGR